MNRASLVRELSELRVRDTLSSHRWLLVCDESFESLFREWEIDPDRLVLVDDIGKSVEQTKSFNFAVVCTEAPEGKVQQLIKEHAVSSAGLFSQMIPRLAAGVAPRFHPAPDTKIDLEYAIMCLPRCGSTLVSKELQKLGAGNPVEHFRGYLQDLLRERAASRFDLIKWWSIVRSGRQVDGVFGTKIIYDFWKMADRYMLEEERLHMLDFLKRVPVIYIERSDKYAQAVSDVIARKTGVWHLWNNTMKETYKGKLESVGDEMADAMTSYQKFRRSERELSTFLKTNAGSVIRIEYEDLVKSPKKIIAEAASRLGLTVPQDYLESELSMQPTTSETHKILRDRLKRELH